MAHDTKLADQVGHTAGKLLRGVVPHLQVENAGEAVKHYERAFAAREITRLAGPDGRLMNCQLEINGDLVMVMDAMPDHGFPFQPSHSFSLQLVVDDAQAWFDRAVAAGCKVQTPVQKMFWGDIWGAVVDPFQIHWGFDQPAEGDAP